MPKIVRTPSETLMAALAECETADNVVIIMRHKEDISWHETTNSRADLLGVLDFVLTCIRGSIMRDEMQHEEGDDDGPAK